MTEDYYHFLQWYVEPLRMLEQLPGGQGGFIALATSCFLYERYVVAVLRSQRKKPDTSAKISQLAYDFGVDCFTAMTFWEVMRDGILHQGMPMRYKQSKILPKWAFHDLYPVMSVEKIDGELWLKVQPWKFMNKVLDLWDANFTLITQSCGFPWANIGSVPS